MLHDYSGLQRRSQHLTGAVTDDLVEQRRTARRPAGRVSLRLLVDYLEHGRTFPNRRANAGPDQTCYGLQIFLGKVRPFMSSRRGPSTGSDHCSVWGAERSE